MTHPKTNDDDALESILAALGERVRALRAKRGLTIQEIALRAGISASMVSTVERGQTSASVGTLHALAEALDVPLDALFLREEPIDPVTTRAEQVVEHTAGGITRFITASHSDNGVEVYDDHYPVDATHAPRPSRHQGWEYGLVVEGVLRVEFEGQSHELHAGDAIQFPADQLHLLRNVFDGETRAIWVNLKRF